MKFKTKIKTIKMLLKQQYCSTYSPHGYSHWSKLMFICPNSDLLSDKKLEDNKWVKWSKEKG